MNIEDHFRVSQLFPVGVCVIDTNGSIVFWNRLLSDWSNKAFEIVKGRNLFEIYPRLSGSIFQERVKEVLAGGPPAIFSSQIHGSIIPIFLPSGEKRIQTTTVLPYLIDDVNYAVIVIEDVTELKREVVAYRRMKDSAILALNDKIQAEKEMDSANEEANFYLDVMAHDLMDINTLAAGYASILAKSEQENTSKYGKKIEVILQRSNDIIQYVSTLRRMRNRDSELTAVSVKDALDKAVKLFDRINLQFIGTDCYVIADKLLPEIFSSLISNCIKHAGREPNVIVSLKEDTASNTVRICILDDGIGMPDSEKEISMNRIAGRDESQTQGFGLYIVKTLVNKYNGTLELSDAYPGADHPGLKVCITLNRA